MSGFKIHIAGMMNRLILAAFLSSTSGIALAQEGDVVARVNGTEITQADIAVAREMYGSQLADMPADAQLSVLTDVLIEMRVTSDAARAANVQEQQQYKQQMAFFEAQTLRALYMDEQIAASVTDQAVRALYDQQVASIPPVTERRLRHILVATEAEATEIIAAVAAGTSFAEIASQRSLDAVSKANGGDLGFMAAGQTIPEIDAAAAALQPGEFTRQPVQSPFGFHVVLLEESRDRPPPPFEAVAPQIRESLQAVAERRLLTELREAAKIEKLVPDVALPQADDGHEH